MTGDRNMYFRTPGQPPNDSKGKPPRPPRNWAWPASGWFTRTLRGLCVFLGAIVLLGFSIGVIGGLIGAVRDKVPGQMVLYIPLDGSITEIDRDSLPFGDRHVTLRDAVDAIELAAGDKRVKGIVAEWQGGSSDLAQLDELRTAILAFRKSGKFADLYGEDFSDGTPAYYLASAFGEIWMQPMGTLAIPGIRAELPYGRALLDKLGVQPDFFARGKYKNLFESFELNRMSPATAESMTSLVNDLGGTLFDGIAAGRHKTLAAVREAVGTGLMTDTEAKQAGFIDRIGYRDELLEGIRKKFGVAAEDDDKLPFYKLDAYARAIVKEREREGLNAPHIALIYAVGEIASGSADSRMAALPGTGPKIEGDDLAGDIREAARDESIKAIVLRVSSPGGSPAASETIRRAMVYAKAHGKPVYVSMGDAAASGGYWISAPADRIYASPLTLTGSIGVTGGKFVLTELWKKLGITWDGVGVGDNAGMESMNQPYNTAQRARMNDMFDHIYQGFVSRVAEGRHMKFAAVDKIAQGRVWSGSQGRALGLVDRLGGLDVTLDDVAHDLHQKNRFALNVEVAPKPQSMLEKLAGLLQGQVRMALSLKSQSAIIRLFAPLLERIDSGRLNIQ